MSSEFMKSINEDISNNKPLKSIESDYFNLLGYCFIYINILIGIDWSQVIMKGITIKGIYGREMYDTWYKMISLLQSGLDIAPAITHEFSSNDFQKAFEVMREGKSGKVIMHWGLGKLSVSCQHA